MLIHVQIFIEIRCFDRKMFAAKQSDELLHPVYKPVDPSQIVVLVPPSSDDQTDVETEHERQRDVLRVSLREQRNRLK